jgi:hypothetical protein
MTTRVWIAASFLWLLLSNAHVIAAAQTVDKVEYEGTAQLLSQNELTLKLRDGQLVVIPSNRIEQLSAVPPGALIQLKKTAAVPGTAGGDPKSAATNEPPLQASVVGAQTVGTVQQVADDQSWMVVRTPQLPKPQSRDSWDIERLLAASLVGDNADKGVLVSIHVDRELRTLVKSLHSGDGVKIVYQYAKSDSSGASTFNKLKELEWRKVQVKHGSSTMAFLGSALFIFLVAFALTMGHPAELYLGADNRYSTSKFQTVLWFWIVISTYIAINVLRWRYAGWDYIGGIEIPTNLLVLSGLSVLGAAGAKLITTTKVESAKTAMGSSAASDPKPPADEPQAGNLINDDFSRTDLGDFQLVVITGIAAVMYILLAVDFMTVIEMRRVITMPDVDATLLALFALSQAGYLGKKVAGDAGAGMTQQQAIKRAEEIGKLISADKTKVEAAEKLVVNQDRLVSEASQAAVAAQTRGASMDATLKAKSAAEAAAKAQSEANQTLKSMENQLAALKTLKANWLQDKSVNPSMVSTYGKAEQDFNAAKVFTERASKNAEDIKNAAEKIRSNFDNIQG